MKAILSMIASAAVAVAIAESTTYNDLGDYAGQTESTSDGFWDTTARAAIAVERTASANTASGFDSRTRTSDESDATINVRRRPFGLVFSIR